MTDLFISLKNTIIGLGWQGEVIMLLATIIFVQIVHVVCKRVLAPAIARLVIKTNFTWDDVLLSPKVLDCICKLIPLALLLPVLPYTFYNSPLLFIIAKKVCEVYIIALFAKFILNIMDAIYRLTEENNKMRNRPLKGIHQMLQVVTILIGLILIISSLFDKSPLELLVGLSAAATVLMLVFKDSIVGLVAGVQLSANDMLRPGDWIVVPGTNADGVVFEVGLTTVKVRNWDNTIATIPPYTLVNESFVNWRGMEESDGRRVKRSINIDMMDIDFLTKEEIDKYKKEGLISENDDTKSLTNSTLFRRYLLNYLKKHPEVNKDMTIMVRQLQAADEGLPFELYFFTTDKAWVRHEEIQSDIMDFTIASAPKFGLKVYQRPTAPLNTKTK